MSDDQIATALGKIMGKLDSLHDEFNHYVIAHEDRHTRHDDRHRVLDDEIKDHAAQINQARGAKGAVIAMASGISAVVGVVAAKIGRLF